MLDQINVLFIRIGWILKRFLFGDDGVELNEQGCQVVRGEAADAHLGFRFSNRYDYDIALGWSGWIQYDTSNDAHYFGIWIHLANRQIFTYCEGDRIMVSARSVQAFRRELKVMEAFYGPVPPVAITIDADGHRTVHYESRPAI